MFTDVVIWLAWSFSIIFGQVIRYHQPVSTLLVQSLATESVLERSDGQSPMTLLDLNLSTIQTLREWAQANRDSTDKRLMPTVLTLAALQVVGLSYILDLPIWPAIFDVIKYVYDLLQKQAPVIGLGSAWYGLLLGVLATSALLLLKFVGGLFSNLAIQGLIIEACIVAEYVKKSAEDSVSATSSNLASKSKSGTGKLHRFLKSLLELIR